MKILTKLTPLSITKEPIVLTIGFFDGVHLGHQKIFDLVRTIKGENGFSCALTFLNHPKTVVNPDLELSFVSTKDHRLKLLKEEDLDCLIILPFTQELQQLSPDDFLLLLKEDLNFTDLVIGPDTTIGKDKEGNLELLKLLSKKYSFKLHPIEYLRHGKVTISSSILRKKISEGDFQSVESYLGRPYSIYAEVTEGIHQNNAVGFPTLNFNVDGLSLPPMGVYKVMIKKDGETFPAVANLGFAPTIDARSFPLLEVHLLEGTGYPYGEFLEVIFQKFIRPEQKFSSIDELKAQITRDIEASRKEF